MKTVKVNAKIYFYDLLHTLPIQIHFLHRSTYLLKYLAELYLISILVTSFPFKKKLVLACQIPRQYKMKKKSAEATAGE